MDHHDDVSMTPGEMAEAYGAWPPAAPEPKPAVRQQVERSYLLVPLTLSQTRHMVQMLLRKDEHVWLERIKAPAALPGYPSDGVPRWRATTGACRGESCRGESPTIGGAWAELLRALVNRRFPA